MYLLVLFAMTVLIIPYLLTTKWKHCFPAALSDSGREPT